MEHFEIQTDTAQKTALARAGSSRTNLSKCGKIKSPTAKEPISGQKYLHETLTLHWTHILTAFNIYNNV